MTMEVVRQFAGETFSSLAIRNYRLYFIGRGFSHVGDWMQVVGVGWLVLDLTGSGVKLGTVLAIFFLPLLLGGPFLGIIPDRFDKRRVMFLTQSIMAALALLLSVLVFFELVQLWMLYAFALLYGTVNAIDTPTRQTFLHEMVGKDHLRNAVTLMSTEANLARALGPLFAGALIAGFGIAFCFFVNALSFVAVLVILSMMREEEMHRETPSSEPIDLLSGFRYVRSVPLIRGVLISMAVIGTLSYEFQVSLPLLAKGTFGGGAADYAALLSAMGAGSVAGGLFAASRQRVALHEFFLSMLLFGISILVTAVMPSVSLATVGMIFVGFFSINLTSVGNTMIQLEADSSLRGRVMALWSMAIFGSTLIGAPIIGFLGEFANPRIALAVSGAAALLTALFGGWRLLKLDRLLPIPAFIKIRREEEEAIAQTKV
ncbi:MAG: MFS transporter [Candidatus Kaiserbacteria bacterium]|nr:MAG: MFS transporter [Candidatus Kaiserbacteria bacterium]